MANIEKRQYVGSDGKARTYWRVRYLDPAGQRRSETFGRKIDAERFLMTNETAKLQGAWVDPTLGQRQFSEVALTWQAAQVHRPSTQALVDSVLRNRVLPDFGSRPIVSITPSEVQGWVKRLAGQLAPPTVEVAYRFLSAIFRTAVADGVIARTPCRDIKLPRVERSRVVPLPTEQVLALADAVPEILRGLVMVGAGAGLRQGEALGLTLPHVDFLRRALSVEQQLLHLDRQEPVLAPPKTDSSRRTIPLPDVVIEALARHLERFPPSTMLQGVSGQLEPLLFTDKKQRPMRRSTFATLWHPAARAVGVPRRTTFHDLRHYYASLLIRHGESVKAVQSRLGHASATETLETYAHLWPDSDDRTRTAVDAVLGGAKLSPEAPELGGLTSPAER